MKEAPATLIPITLMIDKNIPLLGSKEVTSFLCQKVTASLDEYLSLQGIEGSPLAEVQYASKNERVMQVIVHGIRQPYSPETMRRVWQARAPRHLRDLPDRETISYHFPDRWLHEYLLGLDLVDQAAINSVIEFLSELAFAAIMEEQSSLITESLVLQYVGNLSESYQVDADFTANVLAFLLDRGISVADAPTILESIREGYGLGRSSGDTSELLFAKFRRPNLEIIVSPTDFRELTESEEIIGVISVYSDKVSKESRDLMKMMEEGLFWEMGLYLPDLVWNIDPDTPIGLIAFKTNNQTTPYIPLLARDEVLVNDIPDRLKLLNVTATAITTNPASGKLCSVVPIADRIPLESAGLTTWGTLGYLVLLTAGEIKRQAPQLFTADDAAYHLAQIRQSFPVLTETFMKHFSVENLTRVLRALLAERISIRDIRTILERLLQYETISVDAGKLIIFDDRLPISPSSKVFQPNSWQSHYEFLRSGLKRQITSSLSQGQNTIPVYLLDAKLEQWLMTENIPAKENVRDLDDKRHNIRQVIWKEISPSSGMNPIILTTTEPRVSLREIIYREMPNVLIVAYSELAPDVSLQPISRIYIPEEFGKASLR